MPRVKKPAEVKEPVRLRMKELVNGNKSLYLDIYRNGKRSYEYLKLYIIPEIDHNARRQNQATMAAANAIKSKRIIQFTNGEAGIENREKVFLLDWMETYKENQAKRGKKDGNQINVTIRILKDFAGDRVMMDQIDKTFCQNYLDYLLWTKRSDDEYKGLNFDEFSFEFRNSVEHWYPQHPSSQSFDSWADVDKFGNLCIIQRNVNSKFSNLSPASKKDTYRQMIEKGSLKLRLMSSITEDDAEWKETICGKHEEAMLKLLKNACNMA